MDMFLHWALLGLGIVLTIVGFWFYDTFKIGLAFGGLLYVYLVIALVWWTLPSTKLRWRRWLTSREESRAELTLAERYAQESKHDAFTAYVILGCCLAISIVSNEYLAACFMGFVTVAIVGFSRLTAIRVERAWFADNRNEVLELLRFLNTKSKSGGLPPGTRVAPSTSGIVEIDPQTNQAAGRPA
ncbi:hypothetical protein [Bradyrhizobium sp. SZCCHNPS1003]|uniref:hypothetical protein n=1 Tax=Bradyrhizobium sp. SZCCHNPS1003 TaxID=3057330 RepID=UPI0028E3B61E|nr:hypothetical protein [Bradyrhizobium sp. SZCCHNPS1003]